MSSSSQVPQKKNKGRQKMKMEKIANDSNLQVTFSKRREGLFNKASELCILCGARVLVIVFSPSKKVYSYGHPGVETLIDTFLNGDTPNPDPTNAILNQINEANMKVNIRYNNLKLNQLKSKLDIAKDRADELGKAKRIEKENRRIPLLDFNLEQIKLYDKVLSNLQKEIGEKRANFISQDLNASTAFNNTNGPYATGGTNVTNNIGSSSLIYPNNNPSFPQGLNGVATSFIGTRLSMAGGISSTTNTGDVPMIPFSPEFIHNWAGEFYESGALTNDANNVGVVPHQNEFNNSGQGFGVTGTFATGEASIANNAGTILNQNEFNNWVPNFGNTEASATVETSITNGAPGFNSTEVYATGGTNIANNFDAHNPLVSMDLQVTNDLLPNSPNITDPDNQMDSDSTDDSFFSDLSLEFDDDIGSHQFF